MRLLEIRSRWLARMQGMAACAAFVLVALTTSIRAQEATASVGARDTGGFGRIEFLFSQPTGFTARLSGSVLVVEFDRPVASNPEKLPLALPGYLAAARLDPERRSMRFALTRPARIDVKEAAERVFLDLLPTTWTGPPPPMPADVVRELARRAREAQAAIRAAETRTAAQIRHAVSVRLAMREEGPRIVFESPEAGDARLDHNGSDLRIRFPPGAALNEAALRALLSELATDIRVEDGREGPVAFLRLRQNRQSRTLAEEGAFFVDLVADAPAAGPVPRVEATVQEAKPVPAPPPAPAEPATSVPSVPSALSKGSRPDAEPVTPKGAMVDGVATSLRIEPQAGGVRLGIAPRVPAAVFRRGDEVWLVLEGVRSLRMPPPGSAERALVKAIGSEDMPRAVVVRVTPATAGQIGVRADTESWQVDLGPEVPATMEPVRLRRGAGADGRRILRAALPGAGESLWLDDPDSGERIAVAPMSGPPHATLTPQVFVDAHFLPTALGVAVIARADDVLLKTEVDGFTLQREGGLALSQDARAAPGDRPGGDVVIDATAWAAHRRGSVLDNGRMLLRAAADAPKRDRTAARIRYAQFLLANGLGIEAGGVLAFASTEDPVAGQGKTVTLLRAIAAIQSGDLAEAGKILAQPVLALEAEGVLWRAFVDAQNRRHGPALTGFRLSLDVLDRYPESLQGLVRPVVVEAALQGGDAYLASQQVGELERLDAGERDTGLVPLLQGRIAEAAGRTGEALAAYQLAAKSSSRPVEAEARLERALLELRSPSPDRERIKAELETIAMIWRRGEVEVRARARLSEIHAGEARWRDAFAMTKRAVEIQPEHPLTRKLQDETARRFESLFLEGHDEKLSRVEALAIFEEFRSLVPPGARGDEIVRRLADRLYDLDLLDQAAELLAHQVEHRLKGVARSQVGARLAVVHLVNGKPQEALKVLRATRLAALPAELRRARVLLEARTLAELARTELAIEVLAAETGPDVERLRADVYWRGKRWREAGEAYEKALGDRHVGGQPLDDTERGDAVRAAVAYALSSDRLGLDRFRTKFLAKMSDSPDAETFRLVTLDSLSRADAFRETARNVVSAQTLGDFLDAYRKRYPDSLGGKREAKG